MANDKHEPGSTNISGGETKIDGDLVGGNKNSGQNVVIVRESEPSGRQLSALTIALIGVAGAIIAALIGIAPMFIRPAPSTAVSTVLPPPTGESTTFLLVNHRPVRRDFFIDNTYRTSVDPGTFVEFSLPSGKHELIDCDPNATPAQQPEKCGGKFADVSDNPYPWNLTIDPPVSEGSFLTYIAVNQSAVSRDIYVNDEFKRNIPAHSYANISLPFAQLTTQDCAQGKTPKANPEDCSPLVSAAPTTVVVDIIQAH